MAGRTGARRIALGRGRGAVTTKVTKKFMRFGVFFSVVPNLFCLFFPRPTYAADFRMVDADVRHVLITAARLGGFNIVIDDNVKGTVSLNLTEVEPLEAVKFVVAARNFSLEQIGSAYIVTAFEPHEMPRKIHTFALRYANPGETADLIRAVLHTDRERETRSPSGQGNNTWVKEKFDQAKLTVDAATNTLILSGTEAEAAAVRDILRRIDVPAKQVSLEAKVIAVEKNAAKKLGVEWKWSAIPQYPNTDTEYEQQVYTSVDEATGKTVTIRESAPKVNVNRSWQGGNVIPGIVQFGRGPEGHPFEFYYEATINALITDGKAKLLSRPNITTLQGQEATINIGGEVPVLTVATTNSTTTTSVTYRDAGIILRYTPQVDVDGNITAKVHTEVSSPVYVEDLKAYRFQKRSAQTKVRLKNGETMVIGGLIGSEESRSLSKIPFLGDLPILGAFFRHVRNSSQDSEIMIFLTARVLD